MARPVKPKAKKGTKKSPAVKKPSAARLKTAKAEPKFPTPTPRSSMFLVFFLLWVLFCAVTLTFPNFSWLFPGLADHLPFQGSLGASLVLFMGMVWALRTLPEAAPEGDLSSLAARSWLCLFVGVGAFLRLHHASQPASGYSIDCASDITLVRQVVDLSNFQGSFSAINDLLPLWLTTGYTLWHLLPDASSLFIQRLTNTVLDLAAIWAFYLAGKEMAGRRMGVFAAALAAISKPLLVLLVTGWCTSSFTLGMPLVLLFTFRLMKKTDLRHFLYWGASIGFLGYTFIYFQPFIPFFIFTTLAWLFWQKRREGNWPKPGLLVVATSVALLVYFLYYLNAFSDHSWISAVVTFQGGWVPLLMLGLLLSGLALFLPGKSSQKNPWSGWIVGAWMAALLAYPFTTNAALIQRIKQHALVGGGGFLNGPYLLAAFQRLGGSFEKLFWMGGDRSDMSLPGDAFFSYPEVILIALGLAFCLARPNLKRSLILLTATVGLLLHAVATETHSLRLLGCPTPLLLMGALGLDGLLDLFAQSQPAPLLRKAVLVFLPIFWVWGVFGIFSRVYTQWADKPLGLTVAREQAIKDIAMGYQVYLAPNLADGQLTVLYEGHSVHLWHNHNLIFLGPDEKGPDVVVLMKADDDFKKAMVKAFPDASWSELHNSDVDPAKSVADYRCQIPFAALSKPGQELLGVKRVSPPFWRREYSNALCGFDFGFLTWDDKTANVDDPPSPEVNLDYVGVRYKATIHLDQAGEYEITCKAENRTRVILDHHKLFDLSFFRTANYMSPPADEKKTLDLSAGDHEVEMTTCFQRSHAAPELSLQLKGSPGMGKPLWSFVKD